MTPTFEIIHEDSDLLVINKPADLVCHPTKGDVLSSLVSRVRLYLGPGAEAHLINRLDRETTGLVLVAKNLAAARAWRNIWERREVTKIYAALVHGEVAESTGRIAEPLGKDENSRVAIKNCVRPDGALAITEYKVMHRIARTDGVFTWLEVTPLSGRKHQIRIHLAHIRHPLVGDKLYGEDEQIYLDFVEGRLTDDQKRRLRLANHALHAERIQAHCCGRDWNFSARLSQEFLTFCSPQQIPEHSIALIGTNRHG